MQTSAVLAGLGVLLAAYLTWVHFDAGSLVCGLGDCHTVQASAYATIGPVPVAVLGLGMYAVVCAANLLSLVRPGVAAPLAFAAFAVLLAGTLYAAYLTWLEVAVIRAICQWCVVSAVLSAVLLAIQSLTVRSILAHPVPNGEETGGGSLAS
ncbi:MAG: vitamin K epoxide reductase family protein [Thermomicrobiales bacterium]|nr:vitamin K epoxide reductase family protein [Thermomicrobiales bacterium]